MHLSIPRSIMKHNMCMYEKPDVEIQLFKTNTTSF